MKHYSKLLQVYSNFPKIVETQFSKRIKIFRSDNSLDYTQYAFQAILHSYDTVHQLTCPSISLRKMVDSNENFVIFLTLFVLSFSLPKFLLLFGVKLLFILFMLLITFQVLLSKIKLHMSAFLGHLHHHLRSFSSACFVLLQLHEHNKLKPRSKLCFFLAYGETQKGVLVL